MAKGWFVPIEDHLTPKMLFRLVEIAHETTHWDIRHAALELVRLSLRPAVVVMPKPADAQERR